MFQQLPPPPPGFTEEVDLSPRPPAGPGYIPSVRPAPQPPQPGPFDAQGNARAERGEGRQDRAQINGLFNQFNSDPEVRQFRQARTSTTQLRTLGQSGNPYDDIAMVFNFMRSNDPVSSVREGEQATAQNASGIPDIMRNYYNQMLTGERLTPRQRSQMVGTAYRLYVDRSRHYNEQAENYRRQGQFLGGNPRDLGPMFPTATAPRTEDARRQQQPQSQSPWWDWHGQASQIRVVGRRPVR